MRGILAILGTLNLILIFLVYMGIADRLGWIRDTLFDKESKRILDKIAHMPNSKDIKWNKAGY